MLNGPKRNGGKPNGDLPWVHVAVPPFLPGRRRIQAAWFSRRDRYMDEKTPTAIPMHQPTRPGAPALRGGIDHNPDMGRR